MVVSARISRVSVDDSTSALELVSVHPYKKQAQHGKDQSAVCANSGSTHLQVLNGGTDVFRCIAAEWKGVDPDSVSDTLRQQAKQVQPGKTEQIRSHSRMPTADCVFHFMQICYGIIYGMGAKSLGEQMEVDENDAACYIESFKARYKGPNSVLLLFWICVSVSCNIGIGNIGIWSSGNFVF